MSGRRPAAAQSRKTPFLLALGLHASLLGACTDVGDDDPTELAPDQSTGVLAAVAAAPAPGAAVFRCSGDRIALRATGGQFISVVNDVLGGLVAETRTPSDSETFLVYAVGPNQVALRARNGWYVTVVGNSLFTTSRVIGSDTVFTVTPHWNGVAWALQSTSGSFVTAERGGGSVVNVSRRSVGDWQAFTVVCLATSWTTPATGPTPPNPTGWDPSLPPPTGTTTTTPPWNGTVPPAGTTTTTPPWNGTVPPTGTTTTTPPWNGTVPPTGTTTTTPPWSPVPPTGAWTP